MSARDETPRADTQLLRHSRAGGNPESSADAAAALRERVESASASGTPLRIRGGGTKESYGQALEGEILDTRPHRGVIAYDPAELVITARCGTPLSEVESVLAASGQMLPFEPPHFGEAATFGGCIAAGLAGPRRASSGAPRDFVLGATLMNGRGQALHFGGQVMKNVAGYDVARLLAGSLGTLGLVLDVSLKVLPRPAVEMTLRFECGQAEAVQRLNSWAGRPLPISASAWHAGALTVRLSGAEAAVHAARASLGGELLDGAAAAAFWEDLREQRHPFFTSEAARRALWRLSLPPTTPAVSLEPEPLIEWGGAQRWYVLDGRAEEIRRIAAAVGGHATAFRRTDPHVQVFTSPSEPLMAIHRRLKAAFDPAGIFNRGRMYSEL